MLLLNLEASPIEGQVGSAVLDLQGNVVATTSSHHQSIDSAATKLLYQIFLEAGSLHLPSFRRITISASTANNDIRYILTRDDAYIYIVAQKQEGMQMN
jgi:hypothetical protein